MFQVLINLTYSSEYVSNDDMSPDVSIVIVDKNMMSRCKLVYGRYKICLEEEAKPKKITEKEK